MLDARTFTLSLGGTWYGHYGSAPCPVCQPDRRRDQRGLSLRDRADCQGLLIHCHKLNCNFRSILAAAGVADHTADRAFRCRRSELDHQVPDTLKRRTYWARQVWSETRPLVGSPAENYLRGRGITCELPPSLRYHPACWHGTAGQRFPAMVALVEGGANFAIHRTYLRPNGNDKADVTPTKAMLGSVRGGAVQLSYGSEPLVVAEGIETALRAPNKTYRSV